METTLTCSDCGGKYFEVTTDEVTKIHIEDLECFIGDFYQITYHCSICSKKHSYITGSG